MVDFDGYGANLTRGSWSTNFSPFGGVPLLISIGVVNFTVGVIETYGFDAYFILYYGVVLRYDSNFNAVELRFQDRKGHRVFSILGQRLLALDYVPEAISIGLGQLIVFDLIFLYERVGLFLLDY